MSARRFMIAVMNGVNLDQLGNRDPDLYGTLTLAELDDVVEQEGRTLGLEVSCFQTNHEGEIVEHLHGLRGRADGLILNPGAWTHYSWALRDALEIAAVPAVEVHLSDPRAREQWRHVSVVEELCIASIRGRGPDGYREALGAPARASRGGAGVSSPAGEAATAGRVVRLQQQLADGGLDALLIDAPVDLRYVTGFTGSNGLALVPAADSAARARRARAVPHRLPLRRPVRRGGGGGLRALDRRPAICATAVPGLLAAEEAKLGFDAAKLSVKAHAKLRARAAGGLGARRRPCGLVERLRLVKEARRDRADRGRPASSPTRR